MKTLSDLGQRISGQTYSARSSSLPFAAMDYQFAGAIATRLVLGVGQGRFLIAENAPAHGEQVIDLPKFPHWADNF